MNSYSKFNAWLAVKITDAVSTMTCAYVFAALAFVSLPEAIHGGVPTLIAWIAQTFLQLVLLSLIMVGQKIQQDGLDSLHEKHEVVTDFHEQHASDLVVLHQKHDELYDLIKGMVDEKRKAKSRTK